jgi:hypothetical protein
MKLRERLTPYLLLGTLTLGTGLGIGLGLSEAPSLLVRPVGIGSDLSRTPNPEQPTLPPTPPTPDPELPQPLVSVPVTQQEACSAGALEATNLGTSPLGFGAGLYVVLQVRNIGHGECSLSNDIENAQLLASNGTPLQVQFDSDPIEPGSTPSLAPPTVELLPEATSVLDLSWANWCAANPGVTSLDVQVAGTGTLWAGSDHGLAAGLAPGCAMNGEPSLLQPLTWGTGPSSGAPTDGLLPSCEGDLEASINQGQEVLGSWVLTIGIMNTGNPCELLAPVGLALATADGQSLGVTYRGSTPQTLGSLVQQVPISAGGGTSIIMQWSDWCDGPVTTPAGVAVVFSGSPTVLWASPELTGTPSCSESQGWTPAASSMAILGFTASTSALPGGPECAQSFFQRGVAEYEA